mmetsp:Transcript_1291/g.2325  ORF Transcript_1291/g.2325 Transcript_1291/m.2325 type:complete len:142 (+) Transcript_1291:122-547(+)|eukprot:CAMPEP_0168628138 /NCGR_PEP_ID=MMETSP0449_2-20121227/11678_1 /TAXON_ID=1082188 /ORGANISM="Strombidium rassoulzadegani, Strain ras09" /LENGTH=141 /DNA_ID=CAMNT_0008670525 /DNA_START=92 /DNA_END=517 /DNA_ORIENTATION=+
MTQLLHHNLPYQRYTLPTLYNYLGQNYWGFLTKDLSPEEIKDLEEAKKHLENYEKIYSITEYCSTLNDAVNILEKRIMTNNPTIPMNIYRKCGNNSKENLFAEIELFLKAYYDLMDDCKDFPLWQRKLEEDLGGIISFLGI